MSFATFLAVGLGGALGALGRHMATTYFKPRLKGNFPLHTLGINAVACCIAGCVLSVEAHMGNIEHMAGMRRRARRTWQRRTHVRGAWPHGGFPPRVFSSRRASTETAAATAFIAAAVTRLCHIGRFKV